MIGIAKSKASLVAVIGIASSSVLMMAPTQAQSAPEIALPRFVFKDGSTHEAGRCFALKWNNKTYLITTLHQLGPGGGLPEQIPQSQINSKIDHIDVMDFKGNVIDSAKNDVFSKDNLHGTGFPQDIIAWDMSGLTHLQVLTLSPYLPPQNTKVTILTKDVQNPNGDERYSGSVVLSDTGTLEVKTDEPLPAASSGSPIVDARGNFVGMLVGMMNGQRTLIAALPAYGIAARLNAEAHK